jgi:hypothetical protein
VSGLKLNLGCGANHFVGYINVDKFGSPDVRHDLETFPWPWPDNAVSEITLVHVLEHLGQQTDVYLKIMQEMYRICHAEARIHIIVPHFRHDNFYDDPTHVRAVTPLGLALFSQKLNKQWISLGAANSPLGVYLGIDFEVLETQFDPSETWFRLHPEPQVDLNLLLRESELYNNLIQQMRFTLRVVK